MTKLPHPRTIALCIILVSVALLAILLVSQSSAQPFTADSSPEQTIQRAWQLDC